MSAASGARGSPAVWRSCAARTPAEAARRSIELYPLASGYAGGQVLRDGIVLGYGALPEHDFEAALEALGELLAEMTPRMTRSARPDR
jgi:DNA-binding transcriptional MocR family regulator